MPALTAAGSAPGNEARTKALALLARRPLTVAEMRARLLRAGFDAIIVTGVIDRLVEEHLLDDLALAEHFAAVRSERKGHAPARLIRELRSRGVDEDTARKAIERAVEQGAPDPRRLLEREVDRRLARSGGALDRRGYARMYNALLRLGFEPGDIREALEPHAPESLSE